MQIGKEMAIPSILKIGNSALGKIGGYLKAENLDQVVLFFGNGRLHFCRFTHYAQSDGR